MSSGTSTLPLRKIVYWCTYSRVSLLVLQYIANVLIPDHNANVFLYQPLDRDKRTLDDLVFHLFGGLLRWDGQYFMHLALYGYTYENSLAFFPLVPFTTRIMSYLLRLVLPMGIEATILLTFIILNYVFFVLAAVMLYKLTRRYFMAVFAENTVFLFCVNPASIFFIAPYTECSFAFFTFSAIYFSSFVNFNSGRVSLRVIFISCLFISLSILTRSNGLLNLGFLCYFFLYNLSRSYVNCKINLWTLFKYLLLLVVALSVCLSVFVSLQFVHWYHFCTNGSTIPYYNSFTPEIILQSIKNNFVTTLEISNGHWCDFKLFPVPYSYVQEKYWNVGFLKYYEIQQIPNFLLALPVIYLVLSESLVFLSKHWNVLKTSSLFNIFANCFRKSQKLEFFKSIKDPKHININQLLPFIVHSFVLCIFCIFFIHIQVTTRMIFSASPAVYWFALYKNQNVIKLYFLSYFVIGTIMFCNFLPWT